MGGRELEGGGREERREGVRREGEMMPEDSDQS